MVRYVESVSKPVACPLPASLQQQPLLVLGAPVVLVLTRLHEDDLAGRLLAAEDGHLWRILNIPAQADHDPNKGEVDVLDREPGVFMVSARNRAVQQWEAIKVRVGSRTWQTLYRGAPLPARGRHVRPRQLAVLRGTAVDRPRRRYAVRARVRRAPHVVGHDVQGHRGH